MHTLSKANATGLILTKSKSSMHGTQVDEVILKCLSVFQHSKEYVNLQAEPALGPLFRDENSDTEKSTVLPNIFSKLTT